MIVVTAQLLPSVYRHIEWRIVGVMGVTAAIFMPVGTWLLISLEPTLIARGIAAVVLVSSLVLLSGWRYHGPKRLPTTLGIPPVMVYLLSSQDRAEVKRANFTGYFAITLLTLIVWMQFQGLITWEPVRLAASLLIPFMIAVWIGSKLFRKSSEMLYRRVALGLLLCAGLYGLFH